MKSNYLWPQTSWRLQIWLQIPWNKSASHSSAYRGHLWLQSSFSWHLFRSFGPFSPFIIRKTKNLTSLRSATWKKLVRTFRFSFPLASTASCRIARPAAWKWTGVSAFQDFFAQRCAIVSCHRAIALHPNRVATFGDDLLYFLSPVETMNLEHLRTGWSGIKLTGLAVPRSYRAPGTNDQPHTFQQLRVPSDFLWLTVPKGNGNTEKNCTAHYISVGTNGRNLKSSNTAKSNPPALSFESS